ncbi:basic leucine zipper 4-like [Musa acuminata AAA Group]|uniref:basic leucine zipper 4-like n=1 Tax=Musa acuminata AAA Group TaxID=214697 RepID=UPI0031CF4ADA
MMSIVDPAPSPDDFGKAVSPEELRRLRRTISNRESARRCRLRKQRRLEELREWASVLRSENRDLSGRLVGIASRCLLVHRDNNRLLAEVSALGRRLADLRRVLALRHLRRLAAPLPLAGDYFEQAWA